MYTVIIVDDEKEISSGFAQFFPWNRLGFTVVAQFTEARAAYAYVQSHPVDMVVSDIIMPNCTGLDFARMLSETEFAVQPHVVLFSAHENFEYAREALRYKCTDYILKSSEYDELIQIFTRLRETLDSERKPNKDPAPIAGINLAEDVLADQIISTIVDYIKRDPAQANLEQAAVHVYMSTAYVSHYFKQKTGVSFSDYLQSQKMLLAADMLADLQYKIYEVSNRLSYKNPANFTRSFKKYYGISPKEYRYRRLGRVLPEDEEEFA